MPRKQARRKIKQEQHIVCLQCKVYTVSMMRPPVLHRFLNNSHEHFSTCPHFHVPQCIEQRVGSRVVIASQSHCSGTGGTGGDRRRHSTEEASL